MHGTTIWIKGDIPYYNITLTNIGPLISCQPICVVILQSKSSHPGYNSNVVRKLRVGQVFWFTCQCSILDDFS